MKGNIRKIIVGDNYSFNIKYVKGSEYRVGGTKCKLVEFISNGTEDKPQPIDIYVNDGESTFIWKTINAQPLEIEYDINFE
jgi:hypothetical protein